MDDTAKSVVGVSGVSGLVGIQVRNVQAFSTAQQKMLEGLSMLTKQQVEIMKGVVRRSFGNTQTTSYTSDVPGLIGARIEELKLLIMETQANSNALSEIMMRSVGEVASTLQARMLTALDELKTLVEQAVPEKLPVPFQGSTNLVVKNEQKRNA